MYENIPREEYKIILEKMPIFCVDVVLEHQGQVLLIKRKDKPVQGEWWVQGGRLRKLEKLEEAAIRKVKDETGIQAKISKQIGLYEEVFPDGPLQVKQIHNVVAVYLATAGNQNVNIDSSHENYRWISRLEENLHPYIKKIIQDSGVFK